MINLLNGILYHHLAVFVQLLIEDSIYTQVCFTATWDNILSRPLPPGGWLCLLRFSNSQWYSSSVSELLDPLECGSLGPNVSGSKVNVYFKGL